MEILADWLTSHIGDDIILFDLEGRRYEGKLEKVFADFFQIFERRQRVSKVFRFSAIKDFSLSSQGGFS